MRLSLITFVFFLFPFSTVCVLVNRTIDDTDLDNIKYNPSTSWRGSNNSSCFGCLNPDVNHAYQQTFHYGLHAATPQGILRRDGGSGGDDGHSGHGDDSSKSGSSGNTVTVTNTLVNTPPSPTNPAPTQVVTAPSTTSRTTLPSSTTPSTPPSSTAPSPRDVNVTASMNFTGSAIYVYCVLPTQIDSASVVSVTNLTFLLDGDPIGSFVYDPLEDSGSTPQFQYQVPVFIKRNLPQAQHTLDIKAELGSVVLLDYVEYTTLDTSSPTNNATMPSGLAQSNGSKGGGGDDDSHKNALTFGLAIGLTLGVLALLSLGVCISIIRRRRRSARLQRRFGAEEASAHAASPEMRGPEPFIPRYFPGTVVQPTRHSPPPSLSDQDYEDLEETGPSHGLNHPPAPEHAMKPPYGPLRQSSSGTRGRATGAQGGLIDAEDEPPGYQEANRSLLVSIPFTYPPPPAPPPPGLLSPYSPASPRSPDIEDTPTSTTGLRITARHSNAVPPDESSIRTTNRERPR